MNSETGRIIIYAGLAIVLAGIIVYFFHDRLHWFGNLPGDIKVEKKNFSFYFPLMTSIIVSIVLSILIYLIRKMKS